MKMKTDEPEGLVDHSSEVLHLPEILRGGVVGWSYSLVDLLPELGEDIGVRGEEVHRKGQSGGRLRYTMR